MRRHRIVIGLFCGMAAALFLFVGSAVSSDREVVEQTRRTPVEDLREEPSDYRFGRYLVTMNGLTSEFDITSPRDYWLRTAEPDQGLVHHTLRRGDTSWVWATGNIYSPTKFGYSTEFLLNASNEELDEMEASIPSGEPPIRFPNDPGDSSLPHIALSTPAFRDSARFFENGDQLIVKIEGRGDEEATIRFLGGVDVELPVRPPICEDPAVEAVGDCSPDLTR